MYQLQYQISLLEEEADGVSEIRFDDEVVKIGSKFKGKRVLVADYCEDSIKVIRKNLRSFGLYVDVVKSGKDVITKIKNGYKCDMIITNNVFKDQSSGTDLLKELKQNKDFKAPIVIHTISHQQREKFLSLGFDEYLEKQVSIKNLACVLNKLIKVKNKWKKKKL